MNTVFLLLGSNLGNSQNMLAVSKEHVRLSVGEISSESSLYQTAAWGNTDQPDFINQVLHVETDLTAQQTIRSILQIEKIMGRQRSEKNAPRIIDIDILFFNDSIINESHLHVPHPRLQDRRFVLEPMHE